MPTKIVRTKRGASKRKVFEIYHSSTPRGLEELDVDGKKIKLKRGKSVMVDDPGLAEAISQKYGYNAIGTGTQGGEVIVTELEAYNEYRDRSVKRVNYIQGIALPWHRYKDGKRIQ